MTITPAGKLTLDAHVFLNDEELTGAHVVLHLKGYAHATVTHLDLEHPALAGVILPKARTFCWIIGIEGGILIRTEKNETVKVLSSQLTTVLPQGQKTKTCVGGKANGLFIGFRRRELRKLEALMGRPRSQAACPAFFGAYSCARIRCAIASPTSLVFELPPRS